MTNDDIFAVTAIEGGVWVPWKAWQELSVSRREGKRVHAVLWKDGSVWDAHNGFRGPGFAYSVTERERVLTVWEDFKRAKDVLLPAMRGEPDVFGRF